MSMQLLKEIDRFRNEEEYNDFKKSELINEVLSKSITAGLFCRNNLYNINYEIHDTRWLECVSDILMYKLSDIGIFDKIQKQRNNSKFVDFKTTKNNKIEVKARTWYYFNPHGNKYYRYFNFGIKRNKIADYFTLFAFNNLFELKLLNVWIIHKDNQITNLRKIGDYYQLPVCLNSGIIYNNLKKYELSNNVKRELKQEIKRFQSTYMDKLIPEMEQTFNKFFKQQQNYKQKSFQDYGFGFDVGN